MIVPTFCPKQRLLTLTPLFLIAGLTIACGRGAEDSAQSAADPLDAQPAVEQPADGQAVKDVDPKGVVLSVMSGEVERDAPEGDVETLTVDDLVNVEPGDILSVGEGGMGLLTAEGRFSAELVADSLVEIAAADNAAVTLALKEGATRYTMARATKSGGAFVLTIEADEVTVRSDDPASDLILAVEDDLVWVVAVAGEAELNRSRALAQASGGATGFESLSAGQAVAIRRAASTVPVGVDVDSVKRWYLGVASGTAIRPLHEVAFRCQVSSDSAELAYDPVAPDVEVDVLETVPGGELVDVLGREAGGDWVHVVAVRSGTEGWVRTESLTCGAPLELAATEQALVEAAEPVAVQAIQPKAPAAAGTPTPTRRSAGAPVANPDAPANQDGNSGNSGNSGDTGNTGDNGGDQGDASAPTNPPPPTPTPCETDCEITGPPTETPRPPRPTREPTDPPAQPTEPPPQPTDPPEQPTEEPQPPPEQPTDEPAPPPDEPTEESPPPGED